MLVGGAARFGKSDHAFPCLLVEGHIVEVAVIGNEGDLVAGTDAGI